MTLSFWYYRNAIGCIGPRVMEFSQGSNAPGGLMIEENYPAGIRLSEYTTGGINSVGWLYSAPDYGLAWWFTRSSYWRRRRGRNQVPIQPEGLP